MNLVKWLRKNNTKVMAIVVIFILFSFIGGGTLLQRFSQRRAGLHKTVAWFGDDKKITNHDLVLAHKDMEILRILRADDFLRTLGLYMQNLRAILLGELLFSEGRGTPALIARTKQLIRTSGYSVSDKQINDIYRRSMPSHVYWLLLKNEAWLAGIRTSNNRAGATLAEVIPWLFEGATYSQLIGSIINRQGISEKETLATFGTLLTVLEYAEMVCASENVSTRQIMRLVSLEGEKIDVELVKFDSEVFAETRNEPTQQEMVEHLEKYKKFPPRVVSEENPYGFGYKLPDRIALEYIAVKLDDISQGIPMPTEEEKEQYYQKNRQRYTESVPSDPNDPNSPLTEQIRSYDPDVADSISAELLQSRINSQAMRIMQDARTLTDSDFERADTEPSNLASEQYKQAAADYETATEQLREKYNVNIYTGKTGLLSATDMWMDKYLGMLYLQRYVGSEIGLLQIVFAVDELGASELGPYDAPKPKMYENIGPMKDRRERIMAVVRVIQAEKASEPESINHTYSKSSLEFEATDEQISEDIYSVEEKVAEDLKKLAAMDTTRSKAEQFKDLAVKDGWESALEKFNRLYGTKDKQNEAEPNAPEPAGPTEDLSEPFKLQDLAGLWRISSPALKTLAVQTEGSPTAVPLVNERKRTGRFIDQLYCLVPQDSNTVDTVPFIMEFEPEMSCYVIKSISVERLRQDEYLKIKAQQASTEDIIQAQSLAPVHFNPENILKRMNVEWIESEKQTADANAPAEPEGAS